MNRQPRGGFPRSAQLAWLLLALALAGNAFLRWQLRAMPLERDEGEYAYAGQLLLQGVPPYQAAWNMKFPGTYFAYAVLMALCGQTPEGLHTGMILVTSLSTLLVFLIGRRLLNPPGGGLAAVLYVLLSALPPAYGLAGHATHFIVLFALAGTYALLVALQRNSRTGTALAGIAFGMAVLMKQHAVLFCAPGPASRRHGVAPDINRRSPGGLWRVGAVHAMDHPVRPPIRHAHSPARGAA